MRNLAEMALWGNGCHSSVSLGTIQGPVNTNSHVPWLEGIMCCWELPETLGKCGPVDDSGFVMGIEFPEMVWGEPSRTPKINR